MYGDKNSTMNLKLQTFTTLKWRDCQMVNINPIYLPTVKRYSDTNSSTGQRENKIVEE